MTNALGSAVPTEPERERMLALLTGLSQRLRERDQSHFAEPRFAEPRFNVESNSFELRWAGGSREWIVAWISASTSRQLLVWRHPSYRFAQDEQWIYDASRAPTGTP